MHIAGTVVCIVIAVATPARAEMKDWQVRRLLNFKTDCHMEDFVETSASGGPGLFHAICGNVTFYPDGLDLECPDRTDEWTCKILTKPRAFENLDMLSNDRH